MGDIDRLIEAVEAGVISTDLIMDAFGHGWDDIIVLAAYDGSLDAALRLHEALLPGWFWSMRPLGFGVSAMVWADEKRVAEALQDAPARAWLLALLRALKTQEAGQ